MSALRCVSDKAGSCVFRSMLLHMLSGSGKSIRGLQLSKHASMARRSATSAVSAHSREVLQLAQQQTNQRAACLPASAHTCPSCT